MQTPNQTSRFTEQASPETGEQGLLDAVLEATAQNADVVSSDALGAITRAEIDIQVTTAKRFPRSIRTFLQRAREMATLSEDVAASCFYSVPRDGKTVTGPSVRLAEICALAWGNIRYGARLVGDDGKMLTAQGFCHDLESNVANTIETCRRVTRKNGSRYSDDMVITTGNAACAIAKRNAILNVVPRAYVSEVERAARLVAIGNAETLSTRRTKMIDFFKKMGLEESRICAGVGKRGVEDIGLEELGQLRGFATAIKDGQTTVDEAFPELKEAKIAAVKDKLANGAPVKSDASPAAEKQSAPPKQDLEREDAARRISEAIKSSKTLNELETGPGVELQANREFLGEKAVESLLQAYRGQQRLLQASAKVTTGKEDW